MTKKESNNTDQASEQAHRHRRTWPFVLAALVLIFSVVITLNLKNNTLAQIKEDGTLKIITRNSATTYYENLDGNSGFEYDLAKAFADKLGVELEVVIANKLDDVLPMLNGGQAQIAAAGIQLTDDMQASVITSPSYQNIKQQIIYKRKSGQRRIRNAEDLIGKKIIVAGNSAHEQAFAELKKDHPELNWTLDNSLGNDQLLNLIETDEYDVTIMNSNEFQHYRRLFPRLRIAFNIGNEKSLVWAFNKSNDQSLVEAANDFFAEYKEDGQLTQLIERYYGHVDKYSAVETTVFLRHVGNRLSLFESTFKEAGEIYGVDWRLLAAIAYQESHWETDATSPTGVRGIMMLTLKTAAELNVANRLDSRESILGGAHYFLKMRQRIPDDIKEPDRTWMALASYNVGYGHLEDARKLTQKTKGDPDRWIDVKDRLPWLSQKKWYTQTRHGYARGREPVVYVQNIREYYDTLRWLDERNLNEADGIGDKPNKIDAFIPKIL